MLSRFCLCGQDIPAMSSETYARPSFRSRLHRQIRKSRGLDEIWDRKSLQHIHTQRMREKENCVDTAGHHSHHYKASPVRTSDGLCVRERVLADMVLVMRS